jgi:hypothetical protein
LRRGARDCDDEIAEALCAKEKQLRRTQVRESPSKKEKN